MYCWSCGRENPDASAFCSACGKQLSTSKDKIDKQEGKRMNPHLFTISLWLGILLLLGGTFSITVIGSSAAVSIAALGMAFMAFALVFFLICLYRCWTILREFSPRTTPAKAVGFSLIPFFNIYWIFISIYGLAVDANAFTEQGGSKNKISETLSIATCFILILPFINFFALILMTFLVYQWANFYNTVSSSVSKSLQYPAPIKDKYLQGNFNINKVFACGLAGIFLIIMGTEIIKIKRDEKARKNEYADACYNRGHEYLKKGKTDLAIEELSKAISANPDYAEAYTVRGKAYEFQGHSEQAIEDCNKAISLNPNLVEAYINRGIAYRSKSFIKDRKYDLVTLNKAINDFSKAISINQNHAYAYHLRGLAFFEKGQYDLSIADYDKEIALESEDVRAYIARGRAYVEKGEYDRAILDFDRAIITKFPKDFMDRLVSSRAYYYSGEAYAKKGEYDRAIRDYSKALAIDANMTLNFDTHYRRGIIYSLIGKYDQAIEDYTKQIESRRFSYTADAYIKRGITYSQIGKRGKAISDFQKACEMGNEQGCEMLATVLKKK